MELMRTVDWNPASDMQALARVWRDGQKKDCSYFLAVPPTPLIPFSQASSTASSQPAPSRRRVRPVPAYLRRISLTTPRAVFQRQSHKQNLSSCVVDEKEGIERHYTGDNLRQLFQYNEAACQVCSCLLFWSTTTKLT